VLKRKLLLCLGIAIGVGQFAMAEEPAAPSPQTLGMVEAILNKCSEIDPDNAERYHAQVQMVTQGTSNESVGKVRSSDEYKQAYDSMGESLSSIIAADAMKTCRRSLVGK
jgi:hypothetical protein